MQGVVSIDKYGPWGSQDGTNWRLQLGDNQSITEVGINHGYIVDGIGFTVTDGAGNDYITWFGGKGGNYETIALKSNEYITYLSGTEAEYKYAGNERHVSSLKIHTNLNPTGYGPYGKQMATVNPSNFSSPMPLYGNISGFFGKAQKYLGSIGIFVKKSIDKYGPWGSQDGTNWRLHLGDNQSIKEVRINHDYIVDGIGFTVTDGAGNDYITWFGGEGGNSDRIALKTNEHITYLSGTEAEYEYAGNQRHVSSLKIHTNLNPTGYGPYGKQMGTVNTLHFSSPMPIYGNISGFFGKVHRYLGSIGIFVKKRTEKLGPWGNQAATNWSLQLKEHESIQKVTINHGYIVDCIGFTVVDRSGNTSTTWFGGQGGEIDKIVMKPNEHIIQLSGTSAVYQHDDYERVISSLKIHTNLNPTGYGPYGQQKDIKDTTSFSSPTPTNSIISGFFGKSGRYLGSIGLFVIK